MPHRGQDAELKITQLEIELSHQQRLCEQLNQVVYQQGKQLHELKQQLASLDRRFRDFRDQHPPQLSGDAQAERPPHY